MANLARNYQDPTGADGRVIFKLQSKPDSFNQEGRLENSTGEIPRPFSTYYNVFFTSALKQGMGYGQAHLYADKQAKRFIPSDAEFWVSGPRGGVVTKGIGD